MKIITLTRGMNAIVDDIDFEWLAQWCWHAHHCPGKGHSNWYAARMNARKMVYMHKEIAKRAGLQKSDRYDHRDTDSLNNQRNNLRPATIAQNNANSRKRYGCSSQFKNVSWNRRLNKWHAYVNISGKRHNLGLFTDEQEAGNAAAALAKRLFGEFARP